MDNNRLTLEIINSNDNYNINENYIKYGKFLSQSSILIISNKNNVEIYNSLESQKPEYCYIESNYIYDYCTLIEDNHSPLIFICSKDNPIRVLNDKCETIETFILKKHTEEIISPNFIGLDEYGLNLFCGKNFLKKIDLISNKVIDINQKKIKYNLLSSFDFNYQNSFYLIGSYSKQIFLCDYKTNNIELVQNEPFSVNQITFTKKDPYYYFVGYRNSECINLYDIRKSNTIINSFYRNCLSSQRVNFTLDANENMLITGGNDGCLYGYDINKYENIFYLNANEENAIDIEGVSSVDICNNKLLVTLGMRKFNVPDEESGNNNIKSNSNFKIFNIS